MSEQAIEREAAAILAVAARKAALVAPDPGDWSPGELAEAWGK